MIMNLFILATFFFSVKGGGVYVPGGAKKILDKEAVHD